MMRRHRQSGKDNLAECISNPVFEDHYLIEGGRLEQDIEIRDAPPLDEKGKKVKGKKNEPSHGLPHRSKISEQRWLDQRRDFLGESKEHITWLEVKQESKKTLRKLQSKEARESDPQRKTTKTKGWEESKKNSLTTWLKFTKKPKQPLRNLESKEAKDPQSKATRQERLSSQKGVKLEKVKALKIKSQELKPERAGPAKKVVGGKQKVGEAIPSTILLIKQKRNETKPIHAKTKKKACQVSHCPKNNSAKGSSTVKTMRSRQEGNQIPHRGRGGELQISNNMFKTKRSNEKSPAPKNEASVQSNKVLKRDDVANHTKAGRNASSNLPDETRDYTSPKSLTKDDKGNSISEDLDGMKNGTSSESSTSQAKRVDFTNSDLVRVIFKTQELESPLQQGQTWSFEEMAKDSKLGFQCGESYWRWNGLFGTCWKSSSPNQSEVGTFETADLGKTSLDGASPEKDLAYEEVASLDGASLEKDLTNEEVASLHGTSLEKSLTNEVGASLDDTSLEKAPINGEVKDTDQAPVEASDEKNKEESKQGIIEEKHREQHGDGGQSLNRIWLQCQKWEMTFGAIEVYYESEDNDDSKKTPAKCGVLLAAVGTSVCLGSTFQTERSLMPSELDRDDEVSQKDNFKTLVSQKDSFSATTTGEPRRGPMKSRVGTEFPSTLEDSSSNRETVYQDEEILYSSSKNADSMRESKIDEMQRYEPPNPLYRISEIIWHTILPQSASFTTDANTDFNLDSLIKFLATA
jgi:hypothetical protein